LLKKKRTGYEKKGASKKGKENLKGSFGQKQIRGAHGRNRKRVREAAKNFEREGEKGSFKKAGTKRGVSEGNFGHLGGKKKTKRQRKGLS